MLLGGVLLGMLVIAVPAAFLLGAPLGSLAETAAGPLSIILSPLAEVARYIITFIFFVDRPDHRVALLTLSATTGPAVTAARRRGWPGSG